MAPSEELSCVSIECSYFYPPPVPLGISKREAAGRTETLALLHITMSARRRGQASKQLPAIFGAVVQPGGVGVPGGLPWVGWEVSDPMGQNVVVGWGWPRLRCEELQVLKLNAPKHHHFALGTWPCRAGCCKAVFASCSFLQPWVVLLCVCSPSPQLSSVLAPTARSCAGQQQPALLKHEI